MRTLLLTSAVLGTTALMATKVAAQVRIQSSPQGFAYVMGDPDRPMIGISTRSSGKRDTLGLLVESVTRGGPAGKAGIEEGDRLVSVNSVNLRLSPSDAGESDMEGVANRRLIRELEKQKAGDEVELRVYRDGNTRTVRVKTVAADELNQETFAATTGTFRRLAADRAVLGLSLGGQGSRRDTLGILVVGVANEGPASKAGVDEGDRLVAINGVDLRVAGEDAGDWQASSARINRLNREMEKVKAGDGVELRVYSAGQVKSIRVTAAKASEVEGDGFFFDGGAMTRLRSMAIPRPGVVRVRPPTVEFDEPGLRAEIEKSVQATREALKERAATLRLNEKLKAALPRKVSIVRGTSII